jgi:peptidase M28-like protein
MRWIPGSRFRGKLPPTDDALASHADALHQEIENLAVGIGERNVQNRPLQLAQAADYIEAQFRRAGYEAERQSYEVAGLRCSNLEVEIRGTAPLREIIVVGAHYDTVLGSPGADDNASGVAAMLILARRFSGREIGRTLRFVAFVNEERPYAHTEHRSS